MEPRIALYHDQASGERYEEKAFKKTGVKYEKIGPRDMIKEVLDKYDVVFLPGAFPLRAHNKGGFFSFLNFLRRIAGRYRTAVRDYVQGGGGLISVCASVAVMGKKASIPLPVKPYFVGKKPLGLFDFHAKYGPKTGVVDLEPMEYRNSPKARKVVENVLGDYSEDRFSSLYFRGPAITYDKRSGILHPSVEENSGEGQEEVIVARYADPDPALNGKGAIAYREYGDGRTISCSVHPEFSTWDLFDSMIEVAAKQ